MKMTGRSIFTLLLLLLMVVLVVMAFDYNSKAQLMPIAVGTVVFVMSFSQFLGDTFPSIEKFFPFLRQKEVVAAKPQIHDQPDDIEEESSEDDKEKWSSIFVSFICLIGFIVLLYFTNFLVAVPVFLFLFIWTVGKANWFVSLAIAVGVTLFMYILFDLILSVDF